MKKRIWLSSPHMGGSEMQFINAAIESNWVAPVGPNLDAFEDSLKKYCNIENVLAVSSGTAAIHLALILLGVEMGDEVIASTFTFVGSVNPIIYQKAIPVFVDSEPQTWNMCPDLLEETIKQRISKGKKPKAIILVHLYGMPANMLRIQEVAQKYEVPIIEDAAEALGSRYKDKPVGSFGLMSVLSFNGNKIITTSGGGALMSDDKTLVEKARFLSTQARDKASFYLHSQIGYNYRMSNIIAGIGCGQMEIIDQRVKERRFNNAFYKKYLNKYAGISFLNEPNEDYYSNHWLTAILIDKSKSGLSNNSLRMVLENENIESRLLWKPMHLQPVFCSYPAMVNGTSEKLFRTGLCLPSGSNLTENDRKRILSVLDSFISEKH